MKNVESITSSSRIEMWTICVSVVGLLGKEKGNGRGNGGIGEGDDWNYGY